jgi:hypothetical protein
LGNGGFGSFCSALVFLSNAITLPLDSGFEVFFWAAGRRAISSLLYVLSDSLINVSFKKMNISHKGMVQAGGSLRSSAFHFFDSSFR